MRVPPPIPAYASGGSDSIGFLHSPLGKCRMKVTLVQSTNSPPSLRLGFPSLAGGLNPPLSPIAEGSTLCSSTSSTLAVLCYHKPGRMKNRHRYTRCWQHHFSSLGPSRANRPQNFNGPLISTVWNPLLLCSQQAQHICFLSGLGNGVSPPLLSIKTGGWTSKKLCVCASV